MGYTKRFTQVKNKPAYVSNKKGQNGSKLTLGTTAPKSAINRRV